MVFVGYECQDCGVILDNDYVEEVEEELCPGCIQVRKKKEMIEESQQEGFYITRVLNSILEHVQSSLKDCERLKDQEDCPSYVHSKIKSKLENLEGLLAGALKEVER